MVKVVVMRPGSVVESGLNDVIGGMNEGRRWERDDVRSELGRRFQKDGYFIQFSPLGKRVRGGNQRIK